jgi:hypothetical protein
MQAKRWYYGAVLFGDGWGKVCSISYVTDGHSTEEVVGKIMTDKDTLAQMEAGLVNRKPPTVNLITESVVRQMAIDYGIIKEQQ